MKTKEERIKTLIINIDANNYSLDCVVKNPASVKDADKFIKRTTQFNLEMSKELKGLLL